jgi:hypothetical protein
MNDSNPPAPAKAGICRTTARTVGWGLALLAPILAVVFLLHARENRARGAAEGQEGSHRDAHAQAWANPRGEAEAEVVRMAESFIEALSAKDTALLSVLMAGDATLHSVRPGAGGPEVRLSTREEFLSSLVGDGRRFLERIWDPMVVARGSVAVVLAPYDFYLEDQFSHCGTDVFTFLRGVEGWKVAGVTYDVVREGCTPSPLGSPRAGGD